MDHKLFVEILFPLLTMLVGIGLTLGFESLREHFRFRRELRDNAFIDVSGDDWHAAWQTSVDNELLTNTEPVCMEQRGQTVKLWNKTRAPENPKGGYLWEAQLQFVQGRHLMGWYFPLKSESSSSRGTLFCFYDAARKMFFGKWVGAAYDGDLATGLMVISKDRDQSLRELENLVNLHHEVNIISTTFERIQSDFEVRVSGPEVRPRLLQTKETVDKANVSNTRRPDKRLEVSTGSHKKRSGN